MKPLNTIVIWIPQFISDLIERELTFVCNYLRHHIIAHNDSSALSLHSSETRDHYWIFGTNVDDIVAAGPIFYI